MKYAYNPKEWKEQWFWTACDLFTGSDKLFIPENYQYNNVTFAGHKVYMLQGKPITEGLELLAQDIRTELPHIKNEKHHQELTITYCQIMQELSREQQ